MSISIAGNLQLIRVKTEGTSILVGVTLQLNGSSTIAILHLYWSFFCHYLSVGVLMFVWIVSEFQWI